MPNYQNITSAAIRAIDCSLDFLPFISEFDDRVLFQRELEAARRLLIGYDEDTDPEDIASTLEEAVLMVRTTASAIRVSGWPLSAADLQRKAEEIGKSLISAQADLTAEEVR